MKIHCYKQEKPKELEGGRRRVREQSTFYSLVSFFPHHYKWIIRRGNEYRGNRIKLNSQKLLQCQRKGSVVLHPKTDCWGKRFGHKDDTNSSLFLADGQKNPGETSTSSHILSCKVGKEYFKNS